MRGDVAAIDQRHLDGQDAVSGSPVTWKSISGVMVSLRSTMGPAAAGSMNCAVRNCTV